MKKKVVKYITDNCSRVGIELIPCQSTRANAKTQEDQFTSLRNKIAYPIDTNAIDICNRFINELASIICCAIEDISLNNA